MINQVTTINNKNIFSDFEPRTGTERYFLSADFQNDNFVKEEKEKKHGKLVLKISASALLAGFGTLALMKGLPKNTYKYFNKLKSFMEKTFRGLGTELKSEKLNEKYNKSMEKVNKVIDKSQSINNAGWIKDAAFKKLFGLNKYTARLHASITNMFERISLKTVNKAYKTSDRAFSELFELFDSVSGKSDLNRIINLNGKSVSVSEVLSNLAQKKQLIQECLNNDFGIESRNIRHGKMREAAKNLLQDFWKEFRSKKMYKSSIAEELLAKSKTELAEPVLVARATLAGAEKRELNGGLIREMLDTYKEILSPAEYAKLEAAAKKSVKKLDKAIHIDTSEFFDKYRDLQLGCAPTDMLSIGASLGSVGWGLSTADDKDERYSVLLNVGLPIVGSVATTLYFTARLVSGFKSLGLGLLSGLVFAKAGGIADNFRKKYSQKSTIPQKM